MLRQTAVFTITSRSRAAEDIPQPDTKEPAFATDVYAWIPWPDGLLHGRIIVADCDRRG